MSYYAGEYDVAVVGAGHAGCEAGLAAARLGMKTLIFSISLEAIANMPCNPHIGGSSKGHLVREIDALGGEMAKNIDKTKIQIKMLNTSKGPAVHSLRAQADRKRYQAEMKHTLEKQENLEEIKEMTIGSPSHGFIKESLILQEKLIEEKIEQLELMRSLVHNTIKTVSKNETVDWRELLNSINLTGLEKSLNHEDGHYYLVGNSQNTTTNYTYEDSWTMVKGQRNKLAIAISKGVVSQIVINGSTVAVNKNTYDMNDYSLILGAYQDKECNKSKFWKGTIHACKIWNEPFSVAQLKELCGSSSSGGSGDGYREGRTLIWEDDFTGTTLNTANWDYENNYSRPNEVQNYVAGTNNVWVEDGKLVIKAKKESSNGKEWSSGCIHTDNKREFMYGRFEAKIKIPQTVGSFPAFWTLGGNYEEGGGITWPYCGEIDIMEHKNGYAWTTAGALYRTDLVWDNWDAKDLGRVDSGAIGSFDDYHIYAMEWTHDRLDYYVDDRLIGHSDISDDSQWFMFHQPHYILLNQALGAAGGSVPSNMTEYTMYVDWVRVYAPEEAPSGGETTNRIWFEDTSARHMDKWSKLGLIPKFNESWTNKVITWKSSDESVATVCGGRVDSKGVDGSCIITATTLEGNSASITVNVGSGGSTTSLWG